MIFRPKACVVDASALVQLFVVEEQSEKVRAVFTPFFADPQEMTVYVPDLLYIECANILWKYVRRLGYSKEQAQQDLRDLHGMMLPSTPMRDLMPRALQLACDYNISAYDASYVALAEFHGFPLLTADSRLAATFAGSPHRVVLLADVELPA